MTKKKGTKENGGEENRRREKKKSGIRTHGRKGITEKRDGSVETRGKQSLI